MMLIILVASNGLELTLLRELCSFAALITCLLAVDTLGSCETASQFCVPKPETPAEAKKHARVNRGSSICGDFNN